VFQSQEEINLISVNKLPYMLEAVVSEPPIMRISAFAMSSSILRF
jgi:hypothetical protein